MPRFRFLVTLVAVLVVSSSVPVLAQVGSDSAALVSAADGRVVVPVVGDVVVPGLGLPGLPPLPDVDAGRGGLSSGAAVGVADGSGLAEFGDLPVSVRVAPVAVVEGVEAAPVSVGAVVADAEWVTLLSPDVGLAVQVDLFVEGDATGEVDIAAIAQAANEGRIVLGVAGFTVLPRVQPSYGYYGAYPSVGELALMALEAGGPLVVAAGIATGQPGLIWLGSAMGVAPDLAEAAQKCSVGAYGDCGWELGDAVVKWVAGGGASRGAGVLCRKHPEACAPLVSQPISKVAHDAYRWFTDAFSDLGAGGTKTSDAYQYDHSHSTGDDGVLWIGGGVGLFQ